MKTNKIPVTRLSAELVSVFTKQGAKDVLFDNAVLILSNPLAEDLSTDQLQDQALLLRMLYDAVDGEPEIN